MNTTHLSQTLLAHWRQRDRSAPWGRWLIAALMVLTVVASLVFFDGPKRWWLPTLVGLLLIHIGWMVVGSSLQEQNHPTAARCVPGHVRALRQAALVGWVLCTATATLLMWAALDDLVRWQTMLLGNAAAAAFTMWATRSWWLWLAATFYAPLLGVFKEGLAPLWQASFQLWAQHTDAVLALGLVALALLVLGVFGEGDERHRRRYERQSRIRHAQARQLEGKATRPTDLFAGLERIARPFDALPQAWFRHVMRRADNGSQPSVMARLEVVLQSNQHWTYQLVAAASILLFVAITLVVLLTFTSMTTQDLLTHGAMGMGIGIAGMAINPTLSRATFWQTRREQALLMLLPGVPTGTRLNRAVAWMALRHAAIATALTAAALVPLALAADKMLLLWLPLCAAPCAAWSTTASPARMRQPSALTSVAPVLLFYVLAMLAWVATVALALPLVPTAAVVLAASVALGMWRWQRLAHEPAALPTGRLT